MNLSYHKTYLNSYIRFAVVFPCIMFNCEMQGSVIMLRVLPQKPTRNFKIINQIVKKRAYTNENSVNNKNNFYYYYYQHPVLAIIVRVVVIAVSFIACITVLPVVLVPTV